MRYLGIDYGTKRVGLALSDEGGTIAFAHSTVPSGESAVLVATLVEKEGVETIVLGESKDLSGADNPVQEHIANFKNELEKLVTVPVVYAPEFMTSAQAQRNPAGESRPISSPSKRGHKKEALDASSAALILQGYLDRIKT
jgi:putative Holliday junction resolvase